MFTFRYRLEMFFIITLGTAISLFVLVQQNNQTDKRVFSASIPTNTVTTPINIVEFTSMDSPDGTKELTMQKKRTNDTTIYSFNTSSQDIKQQYIFTKELNNNQRLVIPYNTWSPDNEYFFLTELTNDNNNYYVFSASGKPILNTNQLINIQELFLQKLPDFQIEEVTGWAGPTLIVVNTISKINNQKISFWFDVTSQSFIQLSTYFN